MAFFTGGQGKVKLLMLYIIERFRTPITKEQLYTAMVTADGTGFFEMSELLAQLEQEKYVLSVPVRQQQLLYITEKGARLIAAFEREIARSVRDEVMGYADEHRDEIKRENCVVFDAIPQPDGSFRLELSILEKDRAIFEIVLYAPDPAFANRVRENWLRDADSVYLDTLTRLSEQGSGFRD